MKALLHWNRPLFYFDNNFIVSDASEWVKENIQNDLISGLLNEAFSCRVEFDENSETISIYGDEDSVHFDFHSVNIIQKS